MFEWWKVLYQVLLELCIATHSHTLSHKHTLTHLWSDVICMYMPVYGDILTSQRYWMVITYTHIYTHVLSKLFVYELWIVVQWVLAELCQCYTLSHTHTLTHSHEYVVLWCTWMFVYVWWCTKFFSNYWIVITYTHTHTHVISTNQSVSMKIKVVSLEHTLSHTLTHSHTLSYECNRYVLLANIELSEL